MPPIPCAHCGVNFMMVSRNPDDPRLCNNCIFKENQRKTKKEDTMQTIDILIKCPREIQVKIEEYCINQGMDFTKYFLSLHRMFNEKTDSFSDKNHVSIIPRSNISSSLHEKENTSEENLDRIKKKTKK